MSRSPDEPRSGWPSTSDRGPGSADRLVASDQSRELFAHWFGALVANGMLGGVAIGILVGEIRTDPVLEWFLLAIAVPAPLLLVRALLETVRWARFRGVVLELDPAPGSLPGQVGGRIFLPLRQLRRDQCSVTLACIRVREGSDSTFETVVWSAVRTPWVSHGGRGMEVSFAFAPPADLPPADADGEGDGRVKWAVRLVADVPGVDLDLSFPVQVVATAEPLRSTIELLPEIESEWGRGEARLGPGIRMERERGALVLRYGMRRSLGFGFALGLFGALCLGSGAFIFRTTFRGVDGVFDLVFLGFGGLFLLVFGLVGLLLSLVGLQLMFTTRRVALTPAGIRARWRFLGLSSETEVALEEVERIVATPMGQVGQGAKASVRYEVKAHRTAGAAVVLGDGIRGPAHLGRIVTLIERETGRAVRVEVRGPRRASNP